MDPLHDFLNRARREAPDPARLTRLEARTMAALAEARPSRLRAGFALAVAGGLVAIFAALFVTRDTPPRPAPPDFVESVVIVDGHTCIWLEPVPRAEEPAHE